MLAPWKKSYDQSSQHIKKQRHYFATKVHILKAMVFPVVMYWCESWAKKKAEHCRIDAFELWCWRRLLRDAWTSRRSNQSILKKYSWIFIPWIFIGETDAEAKAPRLWPSDVKSQLIGQDPDTGKDWRQEEKRMTEDKMVGWHHQLNGYEFELAPGDGEEQGSLPCCSPWGCKQSDMTEQMNKNNQGVKQFGRGV